MINNKYVKEIKKLNATKIIENKKTTKNIFESKNLRIELYKFV